MLLQGQILDSKEFYAPIITPFEAQLAFQPGKAWTGDYRLDFASLLNHEFENELRDVPQEEEARFSLVDGGLHSGATQTQAPSETQTSTQALVERQRMGLASRQAEGHLMQVRFCNSFVTRISYTVPCIYGNL